MTHFIGRWRFSSVDNIEEFMDAAGTKKEYRSFMRDSQPDMEYRMEDGTWYLAIHIGGVSKEMAFTLGEKFDNITLDGQNVKQIITLDGSTFHEVYMGDTGEEVTLIREIKGDTMTSTAYFKDIKCIWKHNKA